MDKQVKIRILGMTYDQDNNLFQMLIEELVGEHKQVMLAVKQADLGVTDAWTLENKLQLCEAMKGKEKNLVVQRDYSSIRDAKRNEEGIIPQDEIDRINESIDSYPIDEVMNNLHPKSEENANED